MSIDKLTARHEALMRELVLDGNTAREVAAKFDMTESRLSVIRSSPIWIEKES